MKEMDELILFRVCLPKQWVKDVLIPTTNNVIEEDALTICSSSGMVVHKGTMPMMHLTLEPAVARL